MNAAVQMRLSLGQPVKTPVMLSVAKHLHSEASPYRLLRPSLA
jgi:hypothetical protein